MVIIRDRFDFEMGLLTKSPCKRCPHRDDLPSCADHCRLLEEIQLTLARGVSSTGAHPFLES